MVFRFNLRNQACSWKELPQVGENYGRVFYVSKQAHRINVNWIKCIPPRPYRAGRRHCTVLTRVRTTTVQFISIHLWNIHSVQTIMIREVSSMCLFTLSNLGALNKMTINKVFSLVNQNFCIPMWKLSLFLCWLSSCHKSSSHVEHRILRHVNLHVMFLLIWLVRFEPSGPSWFFLLSFDQSDCRIVVWFPWRLGAWHISCFRFDNIYHPRTAHAGKNFSREFRSWLPENSPRQKLWISNSF